MVLTIKIGTRRKDLARIYSVDKRIINAWLEDIGVRHSKTLSPKELILFIQEKGLPNDRVRVDLPIQLKIVA